MKRFVNLVRAALTAALVFALLSCVCSAAYVYDGAADALAGMGLLQGDDSGFRLNDGLTRAEGSALTARLLGITDSPAKAPFTDVPDWAAPYVNALWGKGLVKGMSETTFAPGLEMDAQMFAALMLRALGYTDFAYSGVMDFAAKVGVIDASNYPADGFTRGNAAAIAYTTLSLPTADGKFDTLLDKLVADGKVSAKAAEDTLETFKNYRDYISAAANFIQSNAIAIERTDIGSQKDAEGNYTGTNADTVQKISIIFNTDDPVNSLMEKYHNVILPQYYDAQQTKLLEQMDQITMTYLTNGRYYENPTYGTKHYSPYPGDTWQYPVSVDDLIKEFIGLDFYDGLGVSGFKRLSVKTEGRNTLYSIELPRYYLNSLFFGGYFSSPEQYEEYKALWAASYCDETVEVTIDEKGALVKMVIYDETYHMHSFDAEGNPVVGVIINSTQTATVSATGSAVTVNLPDDLESYIPLDELPPLDEGAKIIVIGEDGELEVKNINPKP